MKVFEAPGGWQNLEFGPKKIRKKFLVEGGGG